ncbi:MAG: alpha/beta hydrolase-fold protein [Saprospiraceae bacterium]|nr:alpha/beta hydrolase-fold protein [Saprospiraceae bacterium]
MKEEYFKWYSHNLDLPIEMLVFGDRGLPLIIFPTTLGSYFEAKDFFLVESIRRYIEAGKVQVYCPDGVNKYSWYNKKVPPATRVRNHMWYDQFIREELVEKVRHQTPTGRVAVAGCSFGGYTASNFAFKYPDVVGWMISMSGSFDIKSFLDGYYDENVYFNNPVDYLPDLNHPDLYRMGIILGTSDWDICKQANFDMSDLLHHKGVRHWLDVVPESPHDWPLWRHMFPKYVQAI